MITWIREKFLKEKPYRPDDLEILLSKFNIYCTLNKDKSVIKNLYEVLDSYNDHSIYYISDVALEKKLDSKILDKLENKQIL